MLVKQQSFASRRRFNVMNSSSTNMKHFDSSDSSSKQQQQQQQQHHYDVDGDIVRTLGQHQQRDDRHRVSMTSSDEEESNANDANDELEHIEVDANDLNCSNSSLITDINFCDSFFNETEQQQQIMHSSSFILQQQPDVAPSSSSEALLEKLSNDLLNSNRSPTTSLNTSLNTATATSTSATTSTTTSTAATKSTKKKAATKKSKSQTPAAATKTTTKKKKKRIVSATYKFRPYQEEKWKERFDDLLKFRESSGGHCLVPHTYPENPTLARWVKRQRYQYKLFQQKEPSSMTQERIDLLANVGFVWHSHEVVWQERLSELMEYKRTVGDCLVPSNYAENPKLATWVKCQRRQYKLYLRGSPSNITVERIRILEKAGFEWELRSSSYSIKNQIAAHQQKVSMLKKELMLPTTSVVESMRTTSTSTTKQEEEEDDDDNDEDPLDFLKDDDFGVATENKSGNNNEEPLDFLMDVLNDLPEDLPEDDSMVAETVF